MLEFLLTAESSSSDLADSERLRGILLVGMGRGVERGEELVDLKRKKLTNKKSVPLATLVPLEIIT